jgi:hypothetical protein
MKTVIVVYMPGHAGNFVARLFSLDPTTMPLIRHDRLEQHLAQGTALPEDFDRLTNYQFSSINQEFNEWQQFHLSYADEHELPQYRLLNIFCGFRYSRIMIPVHPHEFTYFSTPEPPELYCVDLDLDQWGDWVISQQKKLGFYHRHNEYENFKKQKTLYNMKSIDLTKMLHSEQNFLEEYLRICGQMMIGPQPDQALWLRNDWYSVRVKGQF